MACTLTSFSVPPLVVVVAAVWASAPSGSSITVDMPSATAGAVLRAAVRRLLGILVFRRMVSSCWR
ncbi:MAG: hypothetical protein QM777_06485 [Pseudorhodoferax sp.]